MDISHDWHTPVARTEVEAWDYDWDVAPKTEPYQDTDSDITRKHKRDYGEDRNRSPGTGKHASGRVRMKSKAVAKRRKGK